MALNLTKKLTILIGLLGVVLVALLDIAIGLEVSLLLLHVIPVLFVTWYASARWGVLFAVLVTAISAMTIGGFATATRHPYVYYLELGSDFFATLVIVFMQSRLRNSYELLKRQAKSDGLTGCLNKRGFVEQLQAEIDRNKRYDHAFSVVFLDCDHFKEVNDTLGHHTGDALLHEIGRVMRSELRSVDSVGRLGGDEFAMLLRESDSNAAQAVVGQLKRALDAAMQVHRWPVSFSIGIASFEQAPADAAKALLMADALMYEVKKGGKDGILARRF